MSFEQRSSLSLYLALDGKSSPPALDSFQLFVVPCLAIGDTEGRIFESVRQFISDVSSLSVWITIPLLRTCVWQTGVITLCTLTARALFSRSSFTLLSEHSSMKRETMLRVDSDTTNI